MQGNRPAGVILLLVAAALLLAATASPATRAYSGRIVIDHAAAATMSTRRLEDEVAPELSWSAGLLGGGIGESGLDKDRQVCVRADCAAPCPGCPYTRPCTYKDRCRH
jgi:hypothetical protein